MYFYLLRSEPAEAGEIPASGWHESPVGHMPLTAEPKATLSGADEQETKSEPLHPFT